MVAEVTREFNKAKEETDKDKREWIDSLRRAGYKAAHPNDGWVDRERKRVHFVYPYFDDGAGVGDRVMLGCHCGNELPVILTGTAGGPLLTWWTFRDDPG